jgi:DegV family protein with EDD domain
MKKLMIITDSNSGITQKEGEELGIKVVPMPFVVNGEEYLEDISLNQQQFYEKLKDPNADIHTSQPSAYYLEDLFETLLKDYDELVYIPMSSGLSATCQNATAIAQKFDGRVFVVNNQRISVTQKESVYEAIAMAKEGKSGKEIHDYLVDTKMKSIIYIMVATLKYLKKGGRVTPAAAALGSMLRIKPVLIIKGEKLDSFFKALTLKQAKIKMIDQIKEDCETLFKDEYEKGLMVVSVAHTDNEEEALKFKEEILNALPKLKFRFVDPLSLSVSCHIGPGSLAIAIAINSYLN